MYSYYHYTHIFPEFPGEQLERMNSVDYYNITENWPWKVFYCLLRGLFQTIAQTSEGKYFLFPLTTSESAAQCYTIMHWKRNGFSHQTGATYLTAILFAAENTKVFER